MKHRAYADLDSFFAQTGMTQAAFARRVGLTQGQLSKFKNRRVQPSLDKAVRIAAAAHIPIESLLRHSSTDTPVTE